MKYLCACILAVVLLVSAQTFASAAVDVSQVLAVAGGDDVQAAKNAIRQLARSQPDTIKQIADILVEQGEGDDRKARRVIHGLAVYVARPGGYYERRVFNKVLHAALEEERPAEVKRFIIGQIQLTGDWSMIPVLASCLGDDELAESARQALSAITENASAAALRQALPKVQGEVKVGIIQTLGLREDRASGPALVREASSDGEAASMAAVEALGLIRYIKGESVVADALTGGSKAKRRAAGDAYIRLADMKARMGKAPGEAPRDMYIRVLKDADSPGIRYTALSRLGHDPGAVDTVLLYATDQDAGLRTAASAALAGMPDEVVSAAIERALERFGGADAQSKISLLRLLSNRDDPRSDDLLRKASGDRDAQVRVAAWDLLDKTSEPTADMAPTLLQVAKDGSGGIRQVALAAYLKLALAEADEDKSVEMLQTTLSLQPQPDVWEDAVRRLWKLGVQVDPAHEKGFVNQWWILGPFPGEDINKVWPPEEAIDVSKPVQAPDGPLDWTYHHQMNMDGDGIVNLAELMDPYLNVTCYMYAEVVVDKAQDIVLLMGSDDGIRAWVNGKVVHELVQARGIAVDQDRAEASLKAGANKILLKITQGGGDWKACLRLTDKSGKPLKFRQEGE